MHLGNMTDFDIQDILPRVERASHYLGTEINTIKKSDDAVSIRMALAFPDLYDIGTSHFGMQILYHIVNTQPDMLVERVFAPAADMVEAIQSEGQVLTALESGRPVRDFDILGFSLLYELNYTGVLMIMDLSGIPFRSSDRNETHPFIIAGGPCTVNPEPMAPFFDAMVVGDGESVLVEMGRSWISWKDSGNDRAALLEAWSTIEGVYVPSMYTASYTDEGFQQLTPLKQAPMPVVRTVIPELKQADFPDKPVLPFGRPVHDRLRLEIARGCTRGCRFCQAGMIYRPVRERSIADLLEITDASLEGTGYEDISLLSLSTGDYGCLVPLMTELMARYSNNHTSVSLPSIRAGRLTTELMELIRTVRKTGFTIAPEAGSQRLRDVINKNISEEQIFETVEGAFGLGWSVIKLYFMVGLPTETDEDLEALVDLVHRLRRLKGPKGKRSQINVSVTTFIPKPHAPFQWCEQLPLDESLEKFKWLKSQLRVKGVQLKWQDPKVSRLEGVFARGDRKLADVLEKAYALGCRFDGWSDHYKDWLWQEAFAETGIDPDFYTTRTRTSAEPLPWDHIDCRVTREYLISEWEKAMVGILTPDCRFEECTGCGVCDFETVQPRFFDDAGELPVQRGSSGIPSEFHAVRVNFSKTEQARFFGHIELKNMVIRAIRRLGIYVKHSEGFHPHPKVVFDDPLPVGMESLCESFVMTIDAGYPVGSIADKLNSVFPAGLKVSSCKTVPGKISQPSSSQRTAYQVSNLPPGLDLGRVSWFDDEPSVSFSRTNRKGKTRTFELKNEVASISVDGDGLSIEMITGQEGGVRPLEVLSVIFDQPTSDFLTTRVLKLSVAPV